MTDSALQWAVAGQGRPTNFANSVDGPLREVTTSREALAVLDEIESGALKMPILLVHEAGGTTVGPLLGEIGGVISTMGTIGSHIALLAKEYGCACIVGARLMSTEPLRGTVRLCNDGTVLVQLSGGQS